MYLFTGCQVTIISAVTELQRKERLTCDQGVFHLFIYFFFFEKERWQLPLSIKSEMAQIAIADWLLNKRYYLRAPLVIYKHQNKASRGGVQFTRM